MDKKNGKPTLVLLISNDQKLFEILDKPLKNRFGIELHRFSDIEIRNALLMQKPLFLIWDGRKIEPNWAQTISWLRDHFHGLPIMALTQEENQNFHEKLTRMGVVQQFDTNFQSWTKSLLLNIFAVILDHEHIEDKSTENRLIGKSRNE